MKRKQKFYGLTTIGEKGQIVVPVEARKAINLKKGEKLLVFGTEHDILVLIKLSSFSKIFDSMLKRIKNIKKVVNKINKKNGKK